MTDEHKGAIAINYMVNIHVFRGKRKKGFFVYSFPDDCLDNAKLLWESVKDALSISISIPSLGAQGIDRRHAEWFRSERPRRKIAA